MSVETIRILLENNYKHLFPYVKDNNLLDFRAKNVKMPSINKDPFLIGG